MVGVAFPVLGMAVSGPAALVSDPLGLVPRAADGHDVSHNDPLALVSIAYVSPSAVETADLCLRKWAWTKLDRLPKTESSAAQQGVAVHKQHERWLLDGTPYDLTTRAGELALATLHLVPPPGSVPREQVEQEITFEYEGIKLGGKIDLNWFECSLDPPRPVVLDHKTTSDLAWAKLKKEELLGHPQAPTYATWAVEHYAPHARAAGLRGVDWVELRWNYVQTKGRPKPEPSWHVVGAEEARAALSAVVLPGARRILQVVEQANESRRNGRPFGARDLPYNPRACSAFGGCPFRSVCNLSPQEGVQSIMAQSSDFLARLQARTGAAAQAPAVQAPAAQAPAVQAPAAQAPAVQAPAAQAPAVQAPAVQAPAPQHVAQPGFMVPGAAQWSPPAAQHSTTPAMPSQAVIPGSIGYGPQINPPESAAAPAAPFEQPATPEAGPTGAKGKRGRKPKAEAAPAAAVQAPAGPAIGMNSVSGSVSGYVEAELLIAATGALLTNEQLTDDNGEFLTPEAVAEYAKRYVLAVLS